MARDTISPNVPGLDTSLASSSPSPLQPLTASPVTTRTTRFSNTLAANGVIAALVDPFGSGSTFATAGTVPAQLALNGGNIVRGNGAVVVGAEYSIWIVVTSPDGVPQTPARLTFRAVLPLGGTPAVTLPTLTAPASASVAANAAPGTLLFAIGNVPAGVTPTVSPNDGRFAIAGDATNGWKVVIGLSALSAGSVNVAVAAAGATGVQVPVTVTAASGAVAPFAAKSLRTTQDLTTATLAPTAVTAFAAGTGTTGTKEIVVDTSTTFQTWIGLGAALTDASAYVLMTSMTATQRTAFLTQVFSPTSGLGFNILRMPMGDTDYTTRNMNGASGTAAATGNFSVYDNSTTDDGLASFSTAQDNAYVDVIYEQIKAINPNIITIRTPWSPPPFYKTNATLVSPTKDTTYFNATAANIASYAQYFVKDQKDFFAKHGRYSEYTNPGNEPNASPTTYPGCRMNGNDLMALGVAIRSAFDAAGIPTLVLSGDASWGDTTQNGKSLSLYPFQNGAASSFAGAAYHAYNGSPSLMAEMDAYPGKLRFMTEHSGLNTAAKASINWLQFMGDDMIGSPYNGANGIVFWNLVLDANGQPGQAINLQPVANIATDGTVTFSPQYYALAHIAAHVKPGATRVKATTFGTVGSTGTDVQTTAYVNPDTSRAAVLFNAGSSPATVTLKDQQAGNQTTSLTLAAKEVRSVTWKNAAAVVVPDAQAFQVVSATDTSVKVNAVAPLAANGGSPITGYDIWSSATQGGTKTKIASNVASGYEITGLTKGTPVYVNMYPRNSAGPATTSAEQSAAPGSNLHALNLTGVQGADVYGVSSSSTSSASGIREITAHLNYQTYAPASGGTMNLASMYRGSGGSKSNSEWILGSNDTTAMPLVYGYNAAGTFKSATGTASWSSATYKKAIINGSASAYATSFPIGGSTVNGANSGGASLSIPAGSTGFFESSDGITWAQVGALVTAWGTGGINNLGAACTAPSIGSIDTNTANTPPTGQFYRLTVTDGTNTLIDIDFTTQTPGAGPYTANVGGNWTIYPTTGSGISVS